MDSFHIGQLIICSMPYAYVLGSEYRGQRCDYCFKKKSDLRRCEKCGYLYFCDRYCQENGWDLHKLECRYIKRAPHKPSASLRLIALILLKLKHYGKEFPFETVHGRKMTYHSLQSHADDIIRSQTSDFEMMKVLYDLTSYIDEENIPPPEEFVEAFGKLRVNGFSISDDRETQVLGCGLYLGAAAFDHSCEPNAEFIFDGVKLCLRAKEHIPHKDISRVYVSYIEQLQLSEDRRQSLSKLYYFMCQCPRCSCSFFDDKMKAMVVSGEEAEAELRRAKQSIATLQTLAKIGSSTAVNAACRQELLAQENKLGDSNIYRIKTLEIAMNSSIHLKQWTDAMDFGQQLVEPFRMYYGPVSRELGILLFKIGKIKVFYGILPEAKETLLQAESILKLTHGEQHSLCHELHRFLERC